MTITEFRNPFNTVWVSFCSYKIETQNNQTQHNTTAKPNSKTNSIPMTELITIMQKKTPTLLQLNFTKFLNCVFFLALVFFFFD